MAVSFSRTTRALTADRGQRGRLMVLVGMALGMAWAGWFFLGRVGVYEVSRTARIEVRGAARSIATEQGGRLIASGLTIGRQVRAGEVLAELDSRTERLRLAEAEARLAGYPTRIAALQQALAASRSAQGAAARSASAALAMAAAQRRAAQTEATFAGDLAARLRRDADGGGIAPVDAARSGVEASKAAALRDAAAQAERRVAGEAGGAAASRSVAAADAAEQLAALASEWSAAQTLVARLRRELEARRIRAPVDGVIGAIAVVRLGDVLAAGTRLATIVPAGELRVVAEFDAAHAFGRLAEGQPARVRLTGFAWTEYGDLSARVDRIGGEPSGDRLRAELRLPGGAGGTVPLRHGMAGQVEVLVETLSPARLVLRVLGAV